MPTTQATDETDRSLDQFKALIICRGPIAMEALELADQLGMPRPDIVVSKREVFESADARAPWSQHAGLFGKMHIVDDYKDQEAIIEIALRNEIDAVYVGYGYSAESVEFVTRCEQAGLIPISPPSGALEFSGSKLQAKRHVAEKLGIEVLPGSDRAAALATEAGAKDEDLIKSVAEEVAAIHAKSPGQIIRLKAAKSGGGKGQRLITASDQAPGAVKEIWAEISARGVDGDKGVLVEANLSHPRHWEIQVLSDGETTVHFGGRECSIQNAGSQKFVEVSLHPGQYDHYIEALDAKKDAKLIGLLREEQERIAATCASAVKIISSLGYKGAATVEFLVAEDGGPEVLGRPHFMEINSRIQVEHRVSEAIATFGGERVRLVGEQFRIAAGQKLGYSQDDIEFGGYAVEARINASNSNFLIGASGSVIDRYHVPPISDSFYYDDGGSISLFDDRRRRAWEVPNFDSNFGLAVFIGRTQHEALDHAATLLKDFDVRGNSQLRTTIPFHLGVSNLLLSSAPYGKVRTDFSEIFLAFGALAHLALAGLDTRALAPADPIRRLLGQALTAFQTDPALAIGFAFAERRLRQSASKEDLCRVVLTELAALLPGKLMGAESLAVETASGDYPETVAQILAAIESTRVLEFQRHADDLEFEIPDNVSDPRARRLLIEELQDRSVQALTPRALGKPELEELREIHESLKANAAEQIADKDLLDRVIAAIADCLTRIEAGNELAAADFLDLFESIGSVKWTIRKGDLDEKIEETLLHELNRAIRLMRGPNVVAHLAGTIFLKPSPDKPAYVEVGHEVIEDETVVALLENMKMFNEIRAHMSGRVKEIRVENERPVLPGDVILVIE